MNDQSLKYDIKVIKDQDIYKTNYSITIINIKITFVESK